MPDSNFDIVVKLNGQPVSPIGSQSFNLLQTTSFRLSADIEELGTPLVGREPGALTVHVDPSDCKPLVIDAFPITETLKTAFDARFSGSSQFSLRDNKTQVTAGDGVISIAVPLTIHVPDWFDASMNIAIQLAVSGGSQVFVSAPVVNVDVNWSFFQNLASLGCGDAVQSGMSQMAQAFLSSIVDAEIIPAVSQAITGQVADFLKALQQADPQHRAYAMFLLVLSPNGLKITACPH